MLATTTFAWATRFYAMVARHGYQTKILKSYSGSGRQGIQKYARTKFKNKSVPGNLQKNTLKNHGIFVTTEKWEPCRMINSV